MSDTKTTVMRSSDLLGTFGLNKLLDARKQDTDDDDYEGPAPVYAVTPHPHYTARGAEFVVVDNAPWLKSGAQVTFVANGLFGPRPVRRPVLSIQGMNRSRCLFLQVAAEKNRW